jgi:hypothetical protein
MSTAPIRSVLVLHYWATTLRSPVS